MFNFPMVARPPCYIWYTSQTNVACSSALNLYIQNKTIMKTKYIRIGRKGLVELIMTFISCSAGKVLCQK